MRKPGELYIWILNFLFMGCFGSLAWAEPTGLVLESRGTTNPSIQPYTEIHPPYDVELEGNAQLVYLDYRTCEEIAFSGGIARFRLSGSEISGGTKEVIADGRCPRRIKCVGNRGCETTGIVMRGLSPNTQPPNLSKTLYLFSDPNFLLLGSRGKTFAFAQVSRDQKVIFQMALEGGRFQWPENGPALQVDQQYNLTFLPKHTDSLPLELKFIKKPLDPSYMANEFILLRVD
jgi:hypothetical protein